MKASTVALRDQIHAVLRDAGPVPTSTMKVAEAVGLGNGFGSAQVVYPQLLAMLNRGEVERIRFPDLRSAYWRSTG